MDGIPEERYADVQQFLCKGLREAAHQIHSDANMPRTGQKPSCVYICHDGGSIRVTVRRENIATPTRAIDFNALGVSGGVGLQI